LDKRRIKELGELDPLRPSCSPLRRVGSRKSCEAVSIAEEEEDERWSLSNLFWRHPLEWENRIRRGPRSICSLRNCCANLIIAGTFKENSAGISFSVRIEASPHRDP
jgi:hypothetical protein